MDKQIGTTDIVLDESEAVIDIPHFQRAVPTGLLSLFQAEFEAAALNNIAAAKILLLQNHPITHVPAPVGGENVTGR
jgi:hypothetical protein